ncbi:MAG: citrate/2-methylcitrate synthase, partial [Terriglobales bacterium]
MSTAAPAKGLEGVVATNSSICYIDGDRGILAYRGIDIHELADNSTFEETCYLLWYGKLPTRKQLEELRAHLGAERKLDTGILNLIRNATKGTLPMELLRTTVSALSFYDADSVVND